MSDNRPTEWKWKTPEDGKIDGMTRHEWQERGVVVWASRQQGELLSLYHGSPAFGNFSGGYEYAPATLTGLPAAWPAKMVWQWRKLEADMDERTWRAVALWAHAGYVVPGLKTVTVSSRWESTGPQVMAKRGEWWAPADQEGNPCEWPELEPQPVVVIPAAEMTALVLYGHQAMGGKWRWKDGNMQSWVTSEGGIEPSRVEASEQWTPCDGKTGDFCELRRVVSEKEAGQASLEWERQFVEQDALTQKVIAERADWKRRAKSAEERYEALAADFKAAKEWEERARQLRSVLEALLQSEPEVDDG